MRRRALVLGIAVVSLGLIAVWATVSASPFRRVHEGMTLDEAKALLGEPDLFIVACGPEPQTGPTYGWGPSDGRQFHITVDSEQRIVSVAWTSEDDGLWPRIRRWLRL